MSAKKRDYYEVLGVSKTASPDEIKQAFRKLALQHHPDRGGDPEKFKEINEAYQILSDQQKRQQYDRFGFDGVGQFASDMGGFQGTGFGMFDDLFGDLFGGLGGMGRQGGRGARGGAQRRVRGDDLEANLTIEFKDAVSGIKKEMKYTRQTPCPTCEGTGAEPGSPVETCPTCKGTGQTAQKTQTMFGIMQQISTCNNCRGSGKIIKKKCPTCRGEKAVRNQEKVQITVPAGVDDGMTLKVSGHGDIPTKDAVPGDLFVHIRVKPDSRFERHDTDIISNYNCSFIEAIKGSEATIDTIEGPITIKIPPGTQSGDRIRLKEKGFPSLDNRGKARGSQIVTVKVNLPKYSELSESQRELLDKLASSFPATKKSGAASSSNNSTPGTEKKSSAAGSPLRKGGRKN